MKKVTIKNHTLSGCTWFAAWLFTIGFMKLSTGQAILAIIIWPYYIGTALSVI